MPRITDSLTIPEQELSFTFSRSPGPGGQNVNKVNSRVTLWFDIEASASLSDGQKARLRQRLATRINKQGRLWLVAFAGRSQLVNRESALVRFAALLRQALSEEKPRRPTKVPAASRHERLESKRHRAALKRQGRGKVQRDDE